MNDIDFKKIIPRLGNRYAAFEELCCQLARRTCEQPVIRPDGTGGDGGIECYSDTAAGRRGWQAKYVFQIDRLIKQADTSLKTALDKHPELTQFTVCFPFNPSGSKSKRGKNGIEKLKEWKNKSEKQAKENGRILTIETWSDFTITNLLLDHDHSGGIREYFFGTIALSNDWFNAHLDQAFETAGPRYTPELNVDTELYNWLSTFSRQDVWTDALKSKLDELVHVRESITDVLHQPNREQSPYPIWPNGTLAETKSIVLRLDEVIKVLRQHITMEADEYKNVIENLSESASELRAVEKTLFHDIENQHGTGTANSPGWRQMMAERLVSFPAANLDTVRNLASAMESLNKWLRSSECSLAFCHAFVLAGDPGTGKTHGMCDTAKRRHKDSLRSCIVFGHEFSNQPHPWSRIAESLGLSATLGADRLLDCLNAAGESSGYPLLLCIDAINETEPLRYWKDHIASMAESIRARRYLRLCFVCKSTFLDRCLPDQSSLPVVTHRGFHGIERQACQTYFEHFGLRPPIAPILPPELSNPLYLRLACQTLKSRGIDRLPSGWSGSGSDIISSFLDEKAQQFGAEFETSQPKASTRCLMKIAKAVADSEIGSVPRDTACSVISSTVSDASATLTWLIREGLLIEDVPDQQVLGQDTILRPAFERLGDFLVAKEVLGRLSSKNFKDACKVGGTLYAWFKDINTIRDNRGVLGEFSVLAAEQNSGFELVELAVDPETETELLQIVIKSLAFRAEDSLTQSTVNLIRDAFNTKQLAFNAMDAVLNSSWRQSVIDAVWLDRFLGSGSLARRDACWCTYLHKRFESNGVVTSLISAVKELPLNDIEPDIAERWVIVLLWFTAAADRRVKDGATRAATAVLTANTSIIPDIVDRFLDNNDDEIRERALLSCYGALLMSLNAEVTRQVVLRVYPRYLQTPHDFDNALIRDHIRSICELYLEISEDGPQGVSPEDITTTVASQAQAWPLDLPNKEDIESWGNLLDFKPNEFHSDFFKYSMNCLRSWMDDMSKEDMGKWILQRAARDFAYANSDCEHYDHLMLQNYGGGRGKPVWAERIAKKYLWTGLYQLASRLNDHVPRRPEPWEQSKPGVPLILMERRKLDPTIPERNDDTSGTIVIWSFPKPAELDRPKETDLLTWVKAETIPTLSQLVQSDTYEDQRFRPTLAYFTWDGIEKDSDSLGFYRQVWAHVQSYLVPIENIRAAYESLLQRNLLGCLPEAVDFHGGFVGEYPWGTAFDIVEDDEFRLGLSTPLQPSWSEITCQWEYDSTETPHRVHVPSKQFFDGNLHWDGNGGFRNADGVLMFLDPSFRAADPPSLLTDVDFLDAQLAANRMGLIWTMVGEKWIINSNLGGNVRLPWSTFSQVGYRDEAQECFGDLVFFDRRKEYRWTETDIENSDRLAENL